MNKIVHNLNYLNQPCLVEIFNIAKTWIIENIDSFITNLVWICVTASASWLWSLRKKVPKSIKILKKTKGIKYLGFILLYALPLGTIGVIIINQINEPNFKNVSLLIIICSTFIYNVLMNHISKLYKMISELTYKSSKNDLTHKKAINIIFKEIGKDDKII